MAEAGACARAAGVKKNKKTVKMMTKKKKKKAAVCVCGGGALAAHFADLLVRVEFGQRGERFRCEQQRLFLALDRGPADHVVADDDEDAAFKVDRVLAHP